MIAWRSLLEAIQVPWKDRGSNCSRGHINCACPWCGRLDPSYHLTINEESGAYFCLRTPGKIHSGRSLPWLLLGLGVRPHEIDRLIEDHTDYSKRPKLLTAAPARIVPWDLFDQALEHPVALSYLSERSYDNPRLVAKRFDLRFTKIGRFAWRILFPLSCPGDQGSTLAFTGRAIKNQNPRYLTNDPAGGSLYLPMPGPTQIAALQGTSLSDEKKLHLAMLASRSQALLMCEGPFDALTLALTGELPTSGFFYIPDRDQAISDTIRLIKELESIPSMPHVRLLTLPGMVDDLGAMAADIQGLKKWLANHAATYQNGRAPSRTTRGVS